MPQRLSNWKEGLLEWYLWSQGNLEAKLSQENTISLIESSTWNLENGTRKIHDLEFSDMFIDSGPICWCVLDGFGPLATHRGVPVPSCKEAPAGGVAGRWGPASLAGCDV